MSQLQPTPTPLSGIPFRRDAEVRVADRGTGAFTFIFTLGCIAFLAYGFLRKKMKGSTSKSRMGGEWFRWMGASTGGDLQVIQTERLSPRATLHLVHWDGKEWMLGCTEQGITVLGSHELSKANSELGVSK